VIVAMNLRRTCRGGRRSNRNDRDDVASTIVIARGEVFFLYIFDYGRSGDSDDMEEHLNDQLESG
jgi:hypothetical protein